MALGAFFLPAGFADQHAGEEDERAAEGDLDGGGGKWRVHVPGADPGDGGELEDDDDDGDRRRDREAGDEVGDRVTEAAEGGHQAADEAAHEGSPATGEGAVVGE